jgi:hypothetical protein
MVILIRLTQNIADLQMCFVVICPMLLTTVYRDPAVGAFKVYVGWRGTCLRRLAGFEVHGVGRRTCGLVRGVRAICVLSHESCSLADLGYGRVRERVEEVVFGQHELALDALRIDVFIGLERFFESSVRSGRKRTPWQCELCV